MTQNKFWLVWNLAGNAPRKKHETEESAYNEAHRLASMYPQHEYFVLRAERSFKADVKVIETDLTVPEIDTTTTKPKFKVGDRVNVIGFGENIYEISECLFNAKSINIYNLNLIEQKNLYTLNSVIRGINEDSITLAEPTSTPTLTPKFKVGDFVKNERSNEKCEITKIVFPNDDDYPPYFKLHGNNIGYDYKVVGRSINGQALETVLSPWEDESPKHDFKVGDEVEVETESPEPKFKVGDKVCFTKESKFYGETGTIGSFHANTKLWEVEFDHDNPPYSFFPDYELVLAEHTSTPTLTPKFKVGDFVKSGQFQFKYEIEKIALPNEEYYPCGFKGVAYRCGPTRYDWLAEEKLSLWEEEQPKHKFKVGDKVKVKDKEIYNLGKIWKITGFLSDIFVMIKSDDENFINTVHIDNLELAE